MDENAEIDIEALSDEVYIPLNLLPSIIRDLNSRLAALEHEHSAVDITSGTLPAARIAEGSLPGSKIEEGTVTLDRFEKSVRDSLSREDAKTLSEGVRYQKSNGWVLIRVYTARTIQQGWNELGTLPVGYRPEGDLYFPAQVSSSEARGYISSSGRVALYHFSATSSASGAQFAMSFPV